MKLLQIDSSARASSVSRKLTARFAREWNDRYPEGQLVIADTIVKTLRFCLILGMAVILGSNSASAKKSQESGPPGTSLILTIQVDDHVNIDPVILANAEGAAARVFREAKIETRWLKGGALPAHLTANEGSALTHISVLIVPAGLSGEMGLRDNAVGLAPGSGPDRQRVWIFYSGIREFMWRQIDLWPVTSGGFLPTHGLILGATLAHEIGHLLLNTELHSQKGIMRGSLDLNDLNDMSCGLLLFTGSQAETIRADVLRRQGEQEAAFQGTLDRLR